MIVSTLVVSRKKKHHLTQEYLIVQVTKSWETMELDYHLFQSNVIS